MPELPANFKGHIIIIAASAIISGLVAIAATNAFLVPRLEERLVAQTVRIQHLEEAVEKLRGDLRVVYTEMLKHTHK